MPINFPFDSMKQISVLLLTLLLMNCCATSKLNHQIDQSQRLSLKVSPFTTANGMTSELKMQKKYRILYKKDLQKIIKTNPYDTIILTENYDFICFGCPAVYVQIFVKNKLFSYKKEITEEEYQKTFEILSKSLMDSKGYYYSDILELKNEIRNGYGWNRNPERYGTDRCNDGGHTFYTVFYPSGTIESMYMRCWIPLEIRKK